MKTFYFSNMVNEEDITLALDYLGKPSTASKQITSIRSIKKKAALIDIGSAVFLMAVGAGGVFSFVESSSRSGLNWGLMFLLILIACLFAVGFTLLLRGIKRLTEIVLRPEETGSNSSLLDICTRFYHEALCKADMLDF